MASYAVINLKTDPKLKAAAANVADKLGISISTVLNNELRRFAREQHVTFAVPEVPNAKTAALLEKSRKEIEAGDYYTFDTNEDALDFLKKQLA